MYILIVTTLYEISDRKNGKEDEEDEKYDYSYDISRLLLLQKGIKSATITQQ